MKLPKPTEKPCCLQLQATLLWRDRFKSNWMLWLPATLVTLYWLIAPVCRGACWAQCLLTDSSQLRLCEGEHVPELHCTFHLEHCCGDHSANKTVPEGVCSYSICSAVVLALRETMGVCVTIHIFTWHMVPGWRKENPSCWFGLVPCLWHIGIGSDGRSIQSSQLQIT